MGRDTQQYLALGERLRNKAKLVLFQITQPAVDQLAAGGTGVRSDIVFFHEQHGESAPGSIARDPRAVDASPYDQQIDAVGYGCRHK